MSGGRDHRRARRTEDGCAERNAPVGPVGPVAPVAPVPVAPVAPVGPVGPVGPVTPVGPVAPRGMVKSRTCVGPPVTSTPEAGVPGSEVVVLRMTIFSAAPVSPVGPVGPVGPVEPFIYAQH